MPRGYGSIKTVANREAVAFRKQIDPSCGLGIPRSLPVPSNPCPPRAGVRCVRGSGGNAGPCTMQTLHGPGFRRGINVFARNSRVAPPLHSAAPGGAAVASGHRAHARTRCVRGHGATPAVRDANAARAGIAPGNQRVRMQRPGCAAVAFGGSGGCGLEAPGCRGAGGTSCRGSPPHPPASRAASPQGEALGASVRCPGPVLTGCRERAVRLPCLADAPLTPMHALSDECVPRWRPAP
jgi:hypothetical protein